MDEDDFWESVGLGWDIEPRSYFETRYKVIGFRSAVEMAVHHMWKRHSKIWPNAIMKELQLTQVSEPYTNLDEANARIRVLEGSIDYLRYCIDHPVKRDQ